MRTRREFPSPVKRAAFARSQGICECYLLARCGIPGFSHEGCGVRLVQGSINYEHIQPDQLFGLNDLDNAAVLTRTCWKLKTATYDLPTIASNNRKRDRSRGIKPQDHAPLVGTIRSGIKLPMRPRARPIDRATGLER